MCARASVRRGTERSAASGSGLERWAQLRALVGRKGEERVAGLVGELMGMLVVLSREVTLDPRWCSRNGWKEGRYTKGVAYMRDLLG